MSAPAPTPDEKAAALTIYRQVAEWVKAGKSERDIIAALTQAGISAATAATMLKKLNASRSNVTRRYGQRNMTLGGLNALFGALLLTGGIGAPATGVAALLAWLCLLGGGAWFVRGVLQSMVR